MTRTSWILGFAALLILTIGVWAGLRRVPSPPIMVEVPAMVITPDAAYQVVGTSTVPEVGPWLDIAPPRVGALATVEGNWVRGEDRVAIDSGAHKEALLQMTRTPDERNPNRTLYPWYITVRTTTKYIECGVFDAIHGDGWRAGYCTGRDAGIEPTKVYLNLHEGETRTLWLKVGEEYANILSNGAQ